MGSRNGMAKKEEEEEMGELTGFYSSADRVGLDLLKKAVFLV